MRIYAPLLKFLASSFRDKPATATGLRYFNLAAGLLAANFGLI